MNETFKIVKPFYHAIVLDFCHQPSFFDFYAFEFFKSIEPYPYK